MVKRCAVFMCTLIMILVFGFGMITCYAEENEYDTYKQAVSASGADKLNNELSNANEDFFNDNNIDVENPSSITSLNPVTILKNVWEQVKQKALAPFKLLGSLVGIIMLSAMIESIGDTTKNSSVHKMFEVVSVLVCIMIIADPITACFSETVNALKSTADFMMTFVPIFSSIVAVSGGITSAGCYNLLVFSVAQIVIQLANSVFMPMLGMCMSLAVVDAINPMISLTGMINGIKKFTGWCMGFMMTIFTGLLSIQSIVGSSADGLSVKTAKFVVSNLVPVVGSAVSDAYTTVRGSLGVLRGSVGSIGIISLAIMVLPVIINIGMYRLVIETAAIGAEMFASKPLQGLFKNISSVIGMAFSVVICFSLMMVISTAIIMMTVQN